MDRFKFRVWRSIRNAYACNYYACAMLRNGGVTSSEPGLVIEQCTGLKDKNGTLIYEGDIVKATLTKRNSTVSKGTIWNSVTGGVDWNWSVVFEKGEWKIRAAPFMDRVGKYRRVKNRSRLGYKEVPYTERVERRDFTLPLYIKKDLEVIGNIHENPDLV